MNADSESTRIDVTGTLVHVEDDRRDQVRRSPVATCAGGIDETASVPRLCGVHNLVMP